MGEVSTALLTDHYELSMIRAALANGTAHRTSIFEVFARRLPPGRRYGVVAGTSRVLDAIEQFSFDAATIDWLTQHDVVDDATAEWLSSYRFNGDIWGYGEGEVYFPNSPVLVVKASFAEAVVLETLVLSIFNHDSAIASAAARMIGVSGNRPCIEMGSRRTHEWAAVAAARAAYLVGFEASSNLQAGRSYGVPTAGTSAHSFTLLHDSERDAFTAQVAALGGSTTLLVDTYDIAEAVRTGVQVAGPELGAVRIDSGDLPSLAQQVREQLDSLGATSTRIIVTSDLDEYAIAALATAPVDGYGVGTALVTGSGAPTCGFVYKLVARQDAESLKPVAKKSADKTSTGGQKYALRQLSDSGTAEAEVVVVDPAFADQTDGAGTDRNYRPLVEPLIRSGGRLQRESLGQARERHRNAMSELTASALRLSRGEPAIETVIETSDPRTAS